MMHRFIWLMERKEKLIAIYSPTRRKTVADVVYIPGRYVRIYLPQS